MTTVDKARDIATLASELKDATADVTPQDMADALPHLADAAQYLGAVLRGIGDAAAARYKAGGVAAWDDVCQEAYDAAHPIVAGGLHVEQDVIRAATAAFLIDQGATS